MAVKTIGEESYDKFIVCRVRRKVYMVAERDIVRRYCVMGREWT